MIVPSHFVPLAAPGMVALGLRWMLDPESPFYVRPRPSLDLLRWGVPLLARRERAHVARAAPVLRDLHLASRACFEELAAHGDDFGLVKRGLLMLCRTAHGLEEEARGRRARARARHAGRGADAGRGAGARAGRAPGRRGRRPLSAGLPSRARAPHGGAARESLARASVRFVWNARSPAGAARTAASRPRSTRPRASSPRTSSSWPRASGRRRVARDLGLTLPMQAGKGYSLTLARRRRRLPRLCASSREARVAVTPMGGALRFGGTMELTRHRHDASTRRRVRGIVKARAALPSRLRAPATSSGVPAWCGLRPCSPDGLPYLGRFAPLRATCRSPTGHAMMGVSLAPITGRLVAESCPASRRRSTSARSDPTAIA